MICEAFLLVEPHFGLWLKVFGIEPHSSGSKLTDYGGAMISKMPSVTWPEGSFIETVKLWQQEWFYLTDDQQGPSFSAIGPKSLFSWTEKDVPGVNAEEVKVLQGRLKAMVD